MSDRYDSDRYDSDRDDEGRRVAPDADQPAERSSETTGRSADRAADRSSDQAPASVTPPARPSAPPVETSRDGYPTIAEDLQPEPVAVTRTVTARGVMVASGRVLIGAIGIAATAATVLAATLLPLPSHVVQPPGASVVPVPAAQQRACAGPVLRLGDDTGASATVASAVGSPQVRHSATSGTIEVTRIEATGEPSGRSATVLRLEPSGAADGAQPLLSGSQLQSVDSGELAGLAASECVEARSDTWLVGGSTDTGRTTLLTLANPGTVAATVDLTIYSPDGEVEAPGTDGIVVQPNSESVYSLAGFAPGVIAPVVRVVSTGGTVAATLQQSTVRILEPGGVDIVGPAAAPATDVIIPGLVVEGHDRIEAKVGAPGYQDIDPVLRLFVPGDQPAKTTITVSPEGEGDDIAVDFELMADRVTEFPFEHFEDGNYTVRISSDVPLVAGARASAVGASDASDFAWLESAEVMRDRAVANVLAGPNPALHLVNPADTDADITITADGSTEAPIVVTVPAGDSVLVPVDPSESYLIEGFAQLRVAVSYSGDGATSAFTLSPTGPASEPITVYP